MYLGSWFQSTVTHVVYSFWACDETIHHGEEHMIHQWRSLQSSLEARMWKKLGSCIGLLYFQEGHTPIDQAPFFQKVPPLWVAPTSWWPNLWYTDLWHLFRTWPGFQRLMSISYFVFARVLKVLTASELFHSPCQTQWSCKKIINAQDTLTQGKHFCSTKEHRCVERFRSKQEWKQARAGQTSGLWHTQWRCVKSRGLRQPRSYILTDCSPVPVL